MMYVSLDKRKSSAALSLSHGAFEGTEASWWTFKSAICVAIGGRVEPSFSGDVLVHPANIDIRNPGIYSLITNQGQPEITPQTSQLIVTELAVIMPSLDMAGYGVAARKLQEGCRRAVLAHEPLEFIR